MPQNNDISKIPKFILLFIIHTIYVKIVYNFVCRTAKYYSTYAVCTVFKLNGQFRLKFSIYKFLDIFELKSWHMVALIHIIKYHEYNSMRESLRGGRVGLPLPFPGKIKGLFF